MERARHRRSKSASGIEGVGQLQKHKAVSRFFSDSCSYIDGSSEDNMFTLELGQSSFGRASGRPVTKLLAEEMCKETKSKRRTPSVIARLMGLEGLPSLRHVHRQQKRLPDNYEQKNVSINIQPNRQFYDGQSNSRSSMEKHEFKDVYEDLEASYFVNRRCSSRWSASSMLTKSEMALIQQKFRAAKCLSTDEKLHNSKELDDTLDMLDSKKEFLMKFVQRPDSLLVNNLRDLRVSPSCSLGSHKTVLKPSTSAKYKGDAKAWILDRDNSSKHITSRLKREDGLLLEPHNRHISCKSSKIQLEENNEKKILPTRIVVLKPNLGKMQNAYISGSSPDHLQGYMPNFRKLKEYPGLEGGQKLSWRTDSSCNVEFSKPISKEAREIAKEITRRMRGGCDETVDMKSSGFRGYAGDESSYDAHESDFDSESEMFKLSSRSSFGDDNKWCRYSSSSPVEWSVNREAKKRLSERWRITHKYRDLEIVGTSSTLGDMLAIPDGETRPIRLNAKTGLGSTSTRPGSNNGSAIWDGPIGISSRDGWKDEIHRSSSRSRSRSVPPSTGGRSNRRGRFHDMLSEEKHVMPNDTIYCGRGKVVKGNLRHEFFSSQDSKFRSKKPPSCQHIYIDDTDSSSEANFEIQMEANVKDLSEQRPIFQMAAKMDTSESPISDVMIAEHGRTTSSSKSSQLHLTQSSVIENGKAAAHDQEDFSLQELHKGPPEEGSLSLQYLGPELASSESSKEADHASPVSVLEVPFTEDTSSSSESFDRVSAELHELRMQLQLLKMESGSHAEVFTLVPIEDDLAQLSPTLLEGNYVFVAEGWEASYAFDVLIHSGLQECGFDMLKIKWHSPDCPLDPSLFDNLEKKYSDDINGLRWERRLLFDRINSALLEIFQQHVDLCPWVMPKLAGLHSTWRKERVRDALEKLINQESANERALDREMQWSNSREEIDALGNEIEKLLINDMISEILCD